MLRFVTTADTEILATAAAVERLPDGLPRGALRQPRLRDGSRGASSTTSSTARAWCSAAILGGRRGWLEGFDLLRARCAERGIALLALGGEAAARRRDDGLSLAPAGAVAQAGEYLRHGDVDNVEQLLRFLADTFLLEGYGFEPPREVPDLGVYVPGIGDVALERGARRPRSGRARRSASASTARTASPATRRSSMRSARPSRLPAPMPLAVWSYTLRRDADGRVPALELLDGTRRRARHDDARDRRLECRAMRSSPRAATASASLAGLGRLRARRRSTCR